MPQIFRTDIRSLLMYLLTAVGGVLLVAIFVTLISTVEALWGP